jgi:hypothetical protein
MILQPFPAQMKTRKNKNKQKKQNQPTNQSKNSP